MSAPDPISEAAFDVQETKEVAETMVLTLTRRIPDTTSPGTVKELWNLWNIRCQNDEAAAHEMKAAHNFYSSRHRVYHTSPSINSKKYIVDV